MRRTYRSKKETAGGIDRRDLFQNLDEKSSAYEAFSLQNIKQTKRELSCFGSSNPLGVASNRVRKKKYVKRIVKDAGTPCRDDTSPTAYLTPDKSIRVNKPLDPFDLLLMSSPSYPAESVEKKTVPVTSKVDLFDQSVPKKEGRTYTRKRSKMAKKCNYSTNTESSDSDKENSNDRLNSSHNTSDIRTHKLLVEQKVKSPPRKIDESINNIVNNLSLFNKLKNKCNTDDSFNNYLRMNRHRLTRNIQSPILQKFPLCSTPFKVKYRGESIFKFSPIAAINVDKSPTYMTLAELNDSKSNIIALNKEKVNSPKVIEEPCHKSSQELVPVDNIPDVVCDEILPPENKAEKAAQNDNQAVNKYQDDSIDRNDVTEKEINVNHSDPKEASLNDTKPENDVTQLEVVDNSNCSYKNDSDIKQESFVNESEPEYNKSQFDDDKNSNCSEENHNNSADTSDERNRNSLSLQSEDDDKDSLYDTCASDQSSVQEEDVIKEPVVCLQRMNDSLFAKYYDKINAEITESDEKESSLHSEFASFNDSNDSKQSDKDISEIENETDNVSENETNDCDYEVESNEEENSSSNNEEEQCFVTTRRRNDATNNSIMLMFNDTCISSGTDCDRTVLSINKSEKADIKDNINIDDTLTYYEAKERNTRNADEIIDLNKDSEHSDDPVEEHVTRISFVTELQSSDVTDRNSFIKAKKSSLNPRNSIILSQSTIWPRKTVTQDPESSIMSCVDTKPGIVLQPGKKWERSLSIYRRMTIMTDHFDKSILDDICTEKKGRMYRQSIISTMEMQDLNSSLHNDSINSRRTTLVSKPSRSTIRIVKDPNRSRLSLCNTTVFDDLTGFLNEECDDTIIELSKLSIADQTHEVTVLDNFHDTPNRIATPRDYVLRRCNQTDPILFDECYPDTVLKNCHKIGEGVYGEVFLWRDRDGRARVLKIVPIAGNIKVNGESQKDFHEIISEIVIAMELSALRAPIADIERHLDEGKDIEALDLHAIENATDVFNEVLAVRCVYGSYPSRLLDLWDLYDECKGSENDNPAILPLDQQYIVLELANAGQDLEGYQFNNAEQAHALFLQVAYGLAVAEEAFQFEHRDLHWGNVLIAPTEQKFATFVIRGRGYRVARMGVRATVIDYSLSRVSLRLAAGDAAALYNDLAHDDSLFDAVGDYQFQVYRLMRDKLGNDWKNFEPYTNILWLHYTVDKMITALRYKRTNTKIHKHYIDKLKGIKSRILDYGSAAQFVLTDNEL